MIIRREDNKPIEELTKCSHKKVWFTCDDCGIGVLQRYRTYIRQKHGYFCRSCRNKHTANRENVKKKQSLATKKLWKDVNYREKTSKSLSIACKKSWEKNQKRKERLSKNNPMFDDKTRKKVSEKTKKSNNYNWKGGYNQRNIPLYGTYSHQIDFCEQTRRSPDDENILEVRCTYCNKWFIPTLRNIINRLENIKGKYTSENRFYCSDDCKNNCNIYGQKKYPKKHRKDISREVQPQLRKLVFERDNWICQKCHNDKNLHCHHYEGIEINPIESADMDNCITLCKECHKTVHKQDGCSMRRKKC